MNRPCAQRRAGWAQFSLKSLFEYVTLCCILAGLSSLLGIGASVNLMGLALALLLGQGGAALAMLMAATLVAGLGSDDSGALGRQLMTILAATLVCLWYRWRSVRRA